MFHGISSADLSLYDFSARDNEGKWKGLFVEGLKKVSHKVGHSMKAKEDALDYVERLILQLLGMLCSRPSPHNVSEVQERVQRLFPPPIDKWAIDESANAIKQWKKKQDNVVFPVERIHSLLQKEKDLLQHKVDQNVTVFICIVLQYIAADILNLVGNYVKHSRHGEFSTQDIKAAMSCDKVLCELFKLDNTISDNEVEEPFTLDSLSYNEVVADFLQSERQYLRDLQMLLKIFREELASKLRKEDENLEEAFRCIEDIAELTITLISTIEDTVEMTEPNHTPAVGICLLELAESWEFEVYNMYAEKFDMHCQIKLENLLNRKDVKAIVSTAGHGVVEAVKFYFPKLLLEPFHHCKQYIEYVKLLEVKAASELDKSNLNQTISVLVHLQTQNGANSVLHRPTGELQARISGKGSKQIAQQKVKEIKNLVEGFDQSVNLSYFNEFLLEGEFAKIGPGKKLSDRYGYLFDGYLIFVKPSSRRTAVVTGATQHEYRLKESFYMTKVDVRDKDDAEDMKNMFEIFSKDQPPLLLSARSPEEKSNWMAVLVMLTSKSMLDRLLDRILSEEEKKHPLQLPSKEKYRFAEEDSEENIVFDKDNGNHFLIKGATLLKLVERLTHHQYSDPHFINTFLTTYRSFCTPHQLLDLLIERFNVPDPETPIEDTESIQTREMLKRFRKEYVRHVHLRVLNAIKQWVLHHFYDFERDESLQIKLEEFLDTADRNKGKNCVCPSRIFESVRRCLRKAYENSKMIPEDRSYSDVKSPPAIEYHIRCPVSEWNILTIHPVEFARQLTLLESEYYRSVKPSELVGVVWTKKNKQDLAPNLLKMIRHTTNVTRWFEKTIVETENFEERVAIMCRILEMMIVLQDLNNFNGVLAILSAMGSAAVHRLNFSFQVIKLNYRQLWKALEEAEELQKDHYKKYQERLRSIDPPCVPFFGMYLTNILHIEEGNSDFLPKSNDQLINFGKRRRVAEITSEIRQFQYSHYCLGVESNIREFIDNLQPFGRDQSENDISNWLYERSLAIEPRGAAKPKSGPRRWPDISLKSPGIKRNRSHPVPSLPLASASMDALHSSLSRMTLDSRTGDSVSLYNQHSPLTPTQSNCSGSPQSLYPGDFSIFAPVLIGQVPGGIPTSQSYCVESTFNHNNVSASPSKNSLASMQTLNSPPMDSFPPAPPLPPRPRREGSISTCGDGSSPRIASSRDEVEPPPPLPPRKVSPRTPKPPIPRRNSSAMSPSSVSSPHASITSPGRLPTPSSSTFFANSPSGSQPSSGNNASTPEHSQPVQAFVFFQHGSPRRMEAPTPNGGSSLPNSPPVAPQLPPKTCKPNNIGSTTPTTNP